LAWLWLLLAPPSAGIFFLCILFRHSAAKLIFPQLRLRFFLFCIYFILFYFFWGLPSTLPHDAAQLSIE